MHADANGVRDDVDRYIDTTYSGQVNADLNKTVRQYAKVVQLSPVDGDSHTMSLTHATERFRALECLMSTTFWQGLEGAGPVTSGVVAQLLQRSVNNADQIDQESIRHHASAYREQVASPSCRRVLIVPYPQGNLYSNASSDEMYRQVQKPPVGALEIVGVATSAAAVQGSKLYRTSSTDILIGGIRLVLPGTLPANRNWGYIPPIPVCIVSSGT